jgi:hypothetical protein
MGKQDRFTDEFIGDGADAHSALGKRPRSRFSSGLLADWGAPMRSDMQH